MFTEELQNNNRASKVYTAGRMDDIGNMADRWFVSCK